MVFVLDEGIEFSAPLDTVWKLNMSEGEHGHPSLRNARTEIDGEHPILNYDAQMPDGRWAKSIVRLTLFPPLGVVFETLEGPMAGSKSFQFYTPKGPKTSITVVGEYDANGVPDDAPKDAVLHFLDTLFKEDQANIRNM